MQSKAGVPGALCLLVLVVEQVAHTSHVLDAGAQGLLVLVAEFWVEISEIVG